MNAFRPAQFGLSGNTDERPERRPLPSLDWGGVVKRKTCIDCGKPITQNRGKTRQCCNWCSGKRKNTTRVHSKDKTYLAQKANFALRPLKDHPSAGGILALVCATSGIDFAVLTCGGARKSKEITEARELACHLLMEAEPKLSTPDIAKMLGYSDHTAVLGAAKRYRKKQEMQSPAT